MVGGSSRVRPTEGPCSRGDRAREGGGVSALAELSKQRPARGWYAKEEVYARFMKTIDARVRAFTGMGEPISLLDGA